MNSAQTRFTENLPSKSLSVVFSNTSMPRNYDVAYPFRQDSHFLYLTQMQLSPAIWTVLKDETGACTSALFYTPRPIDQQKWIGVDHTHEELVSMPHWDEVHPFGTFWSWFETHAATVTNVFVPFQTFPSISVELSKCMDRVSKASNRRGRFAPELRDLYSILAEIRQIKEASELEIIEKACHISALGHKHLMTSATPAQTEFQMAKSFENFCYTNGATDIAYLTIVASGANATVLHHTPQYTAPNSNDLILVDAGCELKGYASDISRTFPMAKTFTSPQRDLYTVVLNAQKSILEHVKPGISFQKLQERTISLLAQGLKDLDLLTGSLDEILEQKTYEKYYYHGIGHFMGLDVHDVGPYYDASGEATVLQPGMVLTIEPGLYCFDADVPSAYEGIGIRIEDNVVLTESGCRVLTSEVPKEISEIETFRQSVL